MNDVPQRVLYLGPDQLVVLVYNCFYIRDICKNVAAFRLTARGQSPHPRSGLASDWFAYDFSSATRKNVRRRHSCPGSWKNNHACPETDAIMPMRHDGQWYYNDLEPGTQYNIIRNHRSSTGNVDIYSKIRYTCDEFPPATWVEGGDGEDADRPGTTRCAAMRCNTGVKAEQDCKKKLNNHLFTGEGNPG